MILTGYTHHIGVPLPAVAIIAPEHAGSGDPAELAAHCLEMVDSALAGEVREGDLLVVAASIGAGDGLESAVLSLQAVGFAAVVCAEADATFVELAQSYGLPVLVCPEAALNVPDGVLVRLDLATGAIEERALGTRWFCPSTPQPMLDAARRTQLLTRTRRAVEDEGLAG